MCYYYYYNVVIIIHSLFMTSDSYHYNQCGN